MYQGSVNNELLFGRLVGLVTREGISINEGNRRLLHRLSISAPDELLSMNDSINLYMSSGHGFNNMPAPFEGYYSFTPKPFIHCIVLNTANYYPAGGFPKESLSKGVLDKRQFNWMINTCSIIDFPQEWRKITLYDNGDGTGSIKTEMLRHNNQKIYQIAYNDADAKHESRMGLDIDRNVELIFSIPSAVSNNIENHIAYSTS